MMNLLTVTTDFYLTKQLQLRTDTHRLRQTAIDLKKSQRYRSRIIVYNHGHTAAIGINMNHTPGN